MAAWIAGDALVALTAAAAWGGGDFAGGMAVRAGGGSTRAALRVVVVAHGASLAVLLVILARSGAIRSSGALLAWGLAAGVAAALGMAALYAALARGAMGASAAVCGVLGAAIPALVSRILEGNPGLLQTAGFTLAVAAIWTIAGAPPAGMRIQAGPGFGAGPDSAPAPGYASGPGSASAPGFAPAPGYALEPGYARGPGHALEPGYALGPATTAHHPRQTLVLAVLGGIGFGLYFVALRMDNALGLLEPLALARVTSLLSCGLVLAILSLGKPSARGKIPAADMTAAAVGGSSLQRGVRGQGWLSHAAVGWALGAAVLDTGGDLFFVQATRLGRLDVAAVLTSLYPAATILLAAWLLHERPTRRQRTGMVVALLAVVMILL